MTRKRKGLKWLIASIAVVGGISWFEASRLGLTSASTKLEEQLKLARQDGLPLTPDDMRRLPIPDDENAAQILLNTKVQLAMLPGHPFSVVRNWGLTYEKPAVTDASARKALVQLAPILLMDEAASNRPHLDFHWKWTSLLFPDFQGPDEAKDAVRLLVARARIEGMDGKPDAAVRSLLAAARLGRLMSEPPTVIPLLVRLSIESLVFNESCNLLRRDHSPVVINGLRKVLETFGPLPDPRYALRGEFILHRLFIPRMAYAAQEAATASSGSGMDDSYYPSEWILMRLGPVQDLNQANSMRLFRKQYEAIPQDPLLLNRAIGAVKRADEEVDTAGGLGNIATEVMDPVIVNMVEACIGCMARRRVLSVALDVFGRSTHAKGFPLSWLKAGPEGLDPFTDKPLSYRRTPTGFVVYSFGKDRMDDGGRPYRLDSEDRSDISFEYPTLSIRPISPPRPRPPGSAD